MSEFQEKYFEAINSLMAAQEENEKLKQELKSLKESGVSLKLEQNQLLLIEALHVNSTLESKISELKKSKISSEIELKKEISRLQETLSNINMLNMDLVKSDAKCILCERSCSCHLERPQKVAKIRFKKQNRFESSNITEKLDDLPRTEIIPIKSEERNTYSEYKPTLTRLTSLQGVNLTSWRAVVKSHRPKGTLTFLPRKTVNLIEEGIIDDFLVQRLDSQLIPQCKVEEGSKLIPAIPDQLIDEFDEWLDFVIDSQYHETKNEQVISWIDLVAQDFGRELIKNILDDLEYHHRVLKAIRLYLKKFSRSANVPFDSCWIRKSGDTDNIPAIPIALKDSFLEWFRSELSFAFYNDSRKRKAESLFVESSD